MPIPLGILVQSVSGPSPITSDAYQHLESVILTSNQATISFSNLNSTYGSSFQHLQLRGVLRTNRGGFPFDTIQFRFNGNTQSYGNHRLRGDGSTVASRSDVNDSRNFIGDAIPASGSPANIFAPFIIDILDAFETTKNKTSRVLTGAAADSSAIDLTSGFWGNTAAIDSIDFTPIADFVSGSRISLYGLRST